MLEISRINYLDQLNGKLFELVKQFQKNQMEFQELMVKLDKSNNRLTRTHKVTQNLKVEVITIMGIFSAIMLAFVGGTSFTSSTLTRIQHSLFPLNYLFV